MADENAGQNGQAQPETGLGDRSGRRRMTWEELDALTLAGSLELGIPPRAVTGLVDAPAELPIAFDPVPRMRRRRNGWTEEVQRAFISALAECGCVARAARSVGRTGRSAYRLLDSRDSASFARAWDKAIAYGVEQLRIGALERSINGSWVPVVRRGRVVRYEHGIDNRLAIALLSGRRHCAADIRERAASRQHHRQYVREHRAIQAEEKRKADAVRAEHQAILDGIEQERLNPPARRPRILRL